METTTVVEYAIEFQDGGVWRQWFASADREVVDREWQHLQAIKPRVPVRRVGVEVIRDSRTE